MRLMLPSLKWGQSAAGEHIDYGPHLSSEERRRQQRNGTLSRTPYVRVNGMTRQAMRVGTPLLFRDLLLDLARGCLPSGAERARAGEPADREEVA